MSCCSHCKDAEEVFGIKGAKRAMRQYKRKGPGIATKLLLQEIRQSGIMNVELLDVGAGIGILHHELLGKEVSKVVHVDASAAHNEIARAEDNKRETTHLVTYLHGDVVQLKGQLRPVDLVTLDKVICCYPDWDALVRMSAQQSKDLYAITIPREKWIVKLFVGGVNLFQRVSGSSFRVYVHSKNTIDGLLKSMGFEQFTQRESLAWQVLLYRKLV